jgi:L-rhamnose mutarotase
MSRRLCFALDFVADAALIAEYERHHAPGMVWPEVMEDLSARGVEEMEIWRVEDRGFMIAQVSDDYPRPRAEAVQEVIDCWEALMWQFQKALPTAQAGEKWLEMKRLFSTTEQMGGSDGAR